MHRRQLESAREGKLRAACDRCHDLKNRCVRIGGLDSRCDRCERLDIDCVYRNSSRMGRPRGQRKAPVFQPSRPEEGSSRQIIPSTDSERIPGTLASMAGIVLDGAHADLGEIASGPTTLVDSPSDGMSILVATEGIPSTDLDWGVELTHHVNALHVPLFQDESRPSPCPGHQREGAEHLPMPFEGPCGSTPRRSESPTTLADTLVQLQVRLHRLLSASDEEPTFDFVQEGLEAAKSFLSVLQTRLASQHHLSLDSGVLSTAGTTTTGWLLASEGARDSSVPSTDARCTNALPVSYITIQQALTCYSYVLMLLNRVDSALQSTIRAGGRDQSGLAESPSTLSLGSINLASQPALNAKIVLHLVLRLVQHLRAQIQSLASGCKDLSNLLGGRSTLVGTKLPRAATEESASSSANSSSVSIAAMSHAVSDLVVERERLLLERLSALTSSP